MSRRRRGRTVNGIILLDKPVGMSSNQALQTVRRMFDARKAGHTGSLDPFATGMLPLCFGEASKTAGFMLGANKTYRATARMGEATATGDTEGEIVEHQGVPAVDEGQLRVVLAGFLGEISQVPPMYSALKYQGRPLYDYARKGEEVERKARVINILSLELLTWNPPMMEFRVRCSKGTYIRTLAEDIARRLGTCGHLIALRREQVGGFEDTRMHTLEELESEAAHNRLDDCLLPVDAGLAHWPVAALSAEQSERFQHGNPVETGLDLAPEVRVYGPNECLLGLGEIAAGGKLKPNRVFVWEKG